MTLIARLRIILNDVEPLSMRHIEVPLKIRLDRLHGREEDDLGKAARPDRHQVRDLSAAAEGHGGLSTGGPRRRLGLRGVPRALADSDHEQHEDMVRWSGGDFDTEGAGADTIIERFERLAKKWAPWPRKPNATI